MIREKRRLILEPGDKFNRLTFIEEVEKDWAGRRIAKFRCDCGEETITFVWHVVSGKTKSCGCFKSEKMSINGACYKMRIEKSDANKNNFTTGIKNITKQGDLYKVIVKRNKKFFYASFYNLDEAVDFKDNVLLPLLERKGYNE